MRVIGTSSTNSGDSFDLKLTCKLPVPVRDFDLASKLTSLLATRDFWSASILMQGVNSFRSVFLSSLTRRKRLLTFGDFSECFSVRTGSCGIVFIEIV